MSAHDPAPSAVEAGATETSEERRDGTDRSGEPDAAEAGSVELGGGAFIAETAEEQEAPLTVVSAPAPPVALPVVVEPVEPVEHGGDAPAAAAPEGPHCVRCGRPGVEVDRDAGGTPCARRTRSAPCPMTSATSATSAAEAAAKPLPIATIQTTLRRARCPQPAQIERMKQSLATHGQLTPLVAAARPEGATLVDGFKRLSAAEALGWKTVSVVVKPLDATAQWATMLLLNRGPSSMTTLEEALVLRELVGTGLTQTEIGALCARHKAWVSRRIGLVERLHPELVEAMKLGLLHPGSARRLLSLPPGNQLEVSAAIQSARLGPRDTELLVSLWRRTKEASARRALLSEPRASLSKHHPETRRSPSDPRLGPEGQRLCRSLHRFETAARETSRRLSPAPAQDRAILDEELRRAAKAASRLVTELGSARIESDGAGSGGSSETS